ncbi:MAG: serine O-acetyltransferase [Propionivibrio sp.]|uniref:Serine acetyltransferase n=1 Tax=Candidatus Propionivibrio dominans TaxID=2954373 RepID=A0A9D7FKZ8_9RHOO|nr:serine O-acetyltransferase [Candidatus Propionivibrio dominans]MBL0166526.1 serine O-acetyltransferase [Propionivibrio sp.]
MSSEALTMTASLSVAPGFWTILREDLACVFQRDPAARSTLEVLTTYPGVHALIAHRLAHRLWQSGWRFTARLLSFLSRMLTNVDIHPGASIGRRFFIDHGAGVVIGETAKVGDDVTLYHGVTLGGTSWNKGRRHPTLADGVVVGAGAKILGPISIGERVRIGANSVVVKDVPAERTVVGVPGRVVDTRNGGVQEEYGINLDHNLLPDPVAKSIACLIERIEMLEQELAELRHDPQPAEHSGQCRTCSAGDLCCEHESMHSAMN